MKIIDDLTAIIRPDITIKELLDLYPECARYFIDKTLLCVGCIGESYHTLSDVAQSYNLDLTQLLSELREYVLRATQYL